MAGSTTFVIIGGGLAGAKVVEALRDSDFDGQIVLFCEEKQLPYERPPLSKEFLQGSKPEDKVRVHPAEFYTAQQIRLLTGTRATALDAAQRRSWSCE